MCDRWLITRRDFSAARGKKPTAAAIAPNSEQRRPLAREDELDEQISVASS